MNEELKKSTGHQSWQAAEPANRGRVLRDGVNSVLASSSVPVVTVSWYHRFAGVVARILSEPIRGPEQIAAIREAVSEWAESCLDPSLLKRIVREVFNLEV